MLGQDALAGPAASGEDVLTRVYRTYLSAHPTPPGGALLPQTVAIGPLRQVIAPLVPLRPGWDVLDLGTGYGPVAFELAHRQAVRVAGVDRDAAILAAARTMVGELDGWLQPGASVEFVEAGAEAVPCDPASFDLVTACLLLQHVPEPAAVVAEAWRVLRPGGVAFAFDVDDGLGATYPFDGPLVALEGAFDAWQASYGGDRHIGRKLSVLFAAQGFVVRTLEVLPQAQHAETRPGGEARALTVARLRGAREGIVAAGLMDGATFDALVQSYVTSPPRAVCRIEGRVAVVAQKPGPAAGTGGPWAATAGGSVTG